MKWYNKAHVPKGKSIFLEQMKSFVEWLKNAEEGKRCETCFCAQSVRLWKPETLPAFPRVYWASVPRVVAESEEEEEEEQEQEQEEEEAE